MCTSFPGGVVFALLCCFSAFAAQASGGHDKIRHYQAILRIPPSGTNLKSPGVLLINLDAPQGSAPAALQWEFSVPSVIAITTTEITVSRAAQSAGKSLTCVKKQIFQHRSRYVCILAGGQGPIPAGRVAEIQYLAQWDMKGAPIRVTFENILGVSADLKRIEIADVNATIEVK